MARWFARARPPVPGVDPEKDTWPAGETHLT
jgi:hypothetical protein